MTIWRILLPTDFSELSRGAAAVARELAESHGATLHVLHVVEPIIAAMPNPTLSTSVEMMGADESELRCELEAFVRENLSGCDVRVLTALRKGLPIDGIIRYARENAIDLIVIGTHAQGMVRRLLHGSISKSVMERAGCPVVMVPQRGLTRAEDAKACSQ